MKQLPKVTLKKILIACLLFITSCISLILIVRTPTNDRDWSPDQALLPEATISGDSITIKNIRNFTYQSRDEYTPNYYDRTINLNDVVSVDYIVEPLASVAAAHTLLSFGLKDDSHIAISVEIRKEVGEEFSPILGLMNEYELMYVAVDEGDALSLRALHRENPVYIFPTVANQEESQKLFMSMMERMNKLKEKPEFYNTITNSCTTNIADHINELHPNSIGWDYRLVLPKESDQLAYELGLIENTAPINELRQKYLVNDKIKANLNNPDFSKAIRE